LESSTSYGPFFYFSGVCKSNVGGIDPILLAIELGSLKMLERIDRQSSLSWKNQSGQSLLEISTKLRGERDEVTKFL